MIKNTASQKIGAQMVSATDGSAFTGAVTIAVTGDAGTQATGSVGSGACTHEGNGYHTYAPAQAETNYDLIAFTFTGSGAVPATVQVFTRAGDAFTRLGAPAGASVSADIADLPTNAELATSQAAADDATLAAIAALNNPSVGAIADAVFDEAIAGHLGAGSTGEALSNAGAAGTPPTVTEIADEVETRAMTLTSGERAAIANALLDLADAIETGVTLRGSTRLQLAALAGKLSGAAGTTVTFRNAVADSKDRLIATVDSNGNRTAITADQT